MTIERTINLDGTEYPVTISDERETLLMAKAAGRVVVGLGKGAVSAKESSSEEGISEWLPVDYVADSLPIDEDWLEGAARRELGLPWIIAGTERLIIREFTPADCGSIPDDADDSPDEAILKDPDRLKTYINEQYAFFDCGMWAVIRKEDGKIVGMVSLTPDFPADPASAAYPASAEFSQTASEQKFTACALGYHIYTPYRRMGYAREACGRLVELLAERGIEVIAYTNAKNAPSLALIKELGIRCFLH